MSRLALYLLGPPRIERDGVPVDVDTRKAVALLAYIAVTGERHRRAALINLLWPESDRAHGRAALRRTLYTLRKALVDPCLDVDREEIGLDPGADIWLDVDQFRLHLAGCETHGHPATQVCHACVPLLTKATALYRGDFLSGFGLKDSFNFDDWQYLESDTLRRQLAAALERLVDWHSAQREFEPAVRHASRWLALDPLDERVHRQLMQLHAWSGQRSAALRQYEECVQVLHDQLGVPPEEATTQLHEVIKEGRAPPPPSPDRLPEFPAASPPFLEGQGPVDKPVFVARESELAQLSRFLDAALAGRGKVVFITGGAGSGKTALIQEFARRAQAAHADLVIAIGHGNAHTGFGDPYLPFREVLGLLTGDVEAQWAAGAMTQDHAQRLWLLLPLAVQALLESGRDLLDVFVPAIPLVKRAAAFTQWPAGSALLSKLEELVASKEVVPSSPSLQQHALFEQYSQVLRALASQRPLLLALDDLQWADVGSVGLLFYLGRQIEGSRILIVGAYRPDEIALGRPPSTLLGAMEDRSERRPLARERHPLEPVVNEFKRTFGNIELALERAEGQQARGRQFVDALLDSEPNQLGDAFRRTLHQHTAGYPLFTVELLRGMQERGDLVRDGEGRWVEALELEWQTLPARVEAVIAERIGRLPERLRDILTVAGVEGETFTAEVMAQVEATDLGETIRDLSDTLDRKHRLVSAQGVLQLAGQRLSRYRFRHSLFQRHLYNSLDPVKRVHLHHAVGLALERLYGESAKETESVAPQLARHFQEAGTVERAVKYLQQAGARAQRLYANAEAVEYFRRALGLLGDTPPGESQSNWRQEMATRLYENLGDVLEWTGRHDQARGAYQEALGHVPVTDPIWQSHLQRKVGNILRVQSQHESALQAYDLAETALGEATTESTPEWWQEWVQIQLERMWTYYWLGQWREMSELAKIRSVVEQQGTPTQCVNYFLALASMNDRRDRYVPSEETLGFCQIALAISQESENPGEIAWARFMLGFNCLWHGDLDEADKQMQAALALAEETGDVVHQSRCLAYLTILHRKLGQLEMARQYASRSLSAATAGQMLEYTGMAKANLAWLAWREGDLEQAHVEGQAALELWHQLPAGHSSCAFQWTALWPLIGAALARNRVSEASGYAPALLEATQQSLPGALAAPVENAVQAAKDGEPEAARAWLDRALVLAQELGYL